MDRNIVTSIAIAVLLNYTIGCTSLSVVTTPREALATSDPDSALMVSTRKFRAIHLASGDSVVYDGDGGRFYARVRGQDSLFVGKTAEDNLVFTPIGEVAGVSEYQRVFETGTTLWAIAGLAALTAVLIALPDMSNFGQVGLGEAEIPVNWLP